MSMSMCVCATTLVTWKRGRVFDRVFLREGSVPHVKDMKCDQDAWAWIVISSESSNSFLHCTLNKEFRFVLTQFKTIVMDRIRIPLHYILVVYTRVLYGRIFIDLVHLPLGL